MTIVETIPAPGTAARADAEPIEIRFDANRIGELAIRPVRSRRTGRPHAPIVVRWIGSSPPRPTELPTQRVREARRWGVPLLLDWLADQPGETWQQRWMASGADAAGEDWAQEPERWLRRRGKYSENRLELMTSSLLVMVGADVVRPSLAWLLTGGKKRKLVRNMVYGRDGAGFDRLRQLCEKDPAIGPYAVGRHPVSRRGDRRCQGRHAGRHHRWRRAGDPRRRIRGARPRGFGVGDDSDASGGGRARRGHAHTAARSAASANARSPNSSTVTRSRAVRSAICSWPTWPSGNRRSTTPRWLALAYHLVRCFWFDLEQHHPGIDSLRLPREVAGAWKRRLRTKTTT